MSRSRFPPLTREVQFDEKWAFVAKKEKHCDPDDPAEAPRAPGLHPRQRVLEDGTRRGEDAEPRRG